MSKLHCQFTCALNAFVSYSPYLWVCNVSRWPLPNGGVLFLKKKITTVLSNVRIMNGNHSRWQIFSDYDQDLVANAFLSKVLPFKKCRRGICQPVQLWGTYAPQIVQWFWCNVMQMICKSLHKTHDTMHILYNKVKLQHQKVCLFKYAHVDVELWK